MSSIGFHRFLAGCGTRLSVGGVMQGNPINGRQGKRPALGAAHVVGKIEELTDITNARCCRFRQIVERFQLSERRRPGDRQGTGS